MGHSRFGRMPHTPRWRKVVALIAGNADVGTIATGTIGAAERGLQIAQSDEGLSHSFWLLTQITLAAREPDFAASLKQAGVSVPSEPSVFDIVGGFSDAVDIHLRQTGGRTDIGEMAQMAAAETLTALCTEESRNLFGTTAAEVKKAVREFSKETGFAYLAHDFFSRLTQKYLTYHLSRELSLHVGAGRRFRDPAEHAEFMAKMSTHCRQAALIVRTFAGQWYSKTDYQTGITPTKARHFTFVALRKLRDELSVRGAADVE